MGKRVCALEPSTREFALQEVCSEEYSQFGQRVHLDSSSPAGRAFMRNPDGGWLEALGMRGGFAWGAPQAP
eukprot:9632662-Karenia_brevis.AAC.1